MNTERRDFLSRLMRQAWGVYRARHVPGSTVQTFADALRNVWAFVKRQALPPIHGPVLSFRSMVQSPVRRSLGGKAYAYTNARWAGRATTAVGI